MYACIHWDSMRDSDTRGLLIFLLTQARCAWILNFLTITEYTNPCVCAYGHACTHTRMHTHRHMTWIRACISHTYMHTYIRMYFCIRASMNGHEIIDLFTLESAGKRPLNFPFAAFPKFQSFISERVNDTENSIRLAFRQSNSDAQNSNRLKLFVLKFSILSTTQRLNSKVTLKSFSCLFCFCLSVWAQLQRKQLYVVPRCPPHDEGCLLNQMHAFVHSRARMLSMLSQQAWRIQANAHACYYRRHTGVCMYGFCTLTLSQSRICACKYDLTFPWK